MRAANLPGEKARELRERADELIERGKGVASR